jgi:predicted MFS family arabinose efflux permease
VLGRMAAIGQVGTFAALIMVFVIFHFELMSFKATFIILGVVALIGAVAIVRFPHLHEGQLRKVAPKREPLVWKKDYRYYYFLNVLDGARQQIFFSCGLWALANRFELGVAQISLLLMVVTVISITSSSWVGRTIDRRGESGTLSAVNIGYVVALGGFALANNVLLACFFYLIYAFVAPFSSIGGTTYLRKIALPQDVAPSLAMGVTLLHATAIVVPVAAGFILNFVGYQIPFFIACIFAVAAIFVTRRLDPKGQRSAARVALDEAVAAGRLTSDGLPVVDTATEAANEAAEATAILMAVDGGAGEEIAAQGALGSRITDEEQRPS